MRNSVFFNVTNFSLKMIPARGKLLFPSKCPFIHYAKVVTCENR